MSKVRLTNPEGVAAPIGAYSHLAVVPAGQDLLFLAGQIGMMPDGSLPASPEDQFIQALRNVVTILESEGCSADNLIRVNTYLVEPLALDRVRAAREQILGDIKPASTLVYVPRLATKDILVEVEVIGAR